MNELDPNISNLVKAISMAESGGQDNPTSRITQTEGSRGPLQFVPATFKAYGDKYLGGKALNGQALNIDDPSHQRLVAYKYIEDKYNQKNPDGTRKYTAGDIAASWNAGEGKITSWQNHRGVNKFGNAYDTPAYVSKVGKFYNDIKAANPAVQTTSVPAVEEAPTNVAQAGVDLAKDVAASIVSPVESIKNAATTYGGAAVSTLLGNIFGDKGATFSDYVNKNKQTLAENSITKNILGGEAPNTPDLSTAKGFGQLVGNVGQTAFNVAGGGVAKNVGKEVATGALGKLLPALKSVGAGYGYDVSSNLSDTGEIASGKTYVPGAGAAIGATLPIISKVVPSLIPATEKQLMSEINTQFNKAVKPTVSGKADIKAVERYNSNTIDALTAIAKNPELKFGDDSLGFVNRTPESLAELSDAIRQTKPQIFKQYNDLTKQATGQGATLDLNNIANELDPIINSKSLGISNPSTIQYASNLKDRLSKAGMIDAETAEEVIKNYNDNLSAFYKNPSYETASRVGVDALVANKLRQQLDSLIEGATGKEYQSLKNLYGSLKAIEKDVTKRSIVEGRKQPVGLMDYADIFTGGELLNGLLTLNPALLAKAGAQKGIKEWFKYLNNPDRAVKDIFKKIEKLNNYRLSPSTNPTQNPTMSAKNANISNTLSQEAGTVNPTTVDKYTPDAQLPVIDFGEKAKSRYTQDLGLPEVTGAPKVYTPKPEYEPYTPDNKLPVIKGVVGATTAGAAGLAGLNQTEAATTDNAIERSKVDNSATTTIGKVSMPSKDNPLYSAYDNEISTAENLVKSTLGITLPKGLIKTILATESGFGTDDRSYNPKLGENAWLVGLTSDAQKELTTRLKGDFAVDPSLVNPDSIQGAINTAALYIALKSRVSKGQDSTGSKIIDDVVHKQLLSDPVKLYSTKYSNKSEAAKKAFEIRYKYIREN